MLMVSVSGTAVKTRDEKSLLAGHRRSVTGRVCRQKGIVEKEGYQLDTRRQAQARIRALKCWLSTTPQMILIARGDTDR